MSFNFKKGNLVLSKVPFFLFLFLFIAGCAVLATRPVQEMSDAHAALKGAREVNADTLAPQLYRQSVDLYQQARRQYRLKYYYEASDLAKKSRFLAEQAEYESIRAGGKRETVVSDPLSPNMLQLAPTPGPADTTLSNIPPPTPNLPSTITGPTLTIGQPPQPTAAQGQAGVSAQGAAPTIDPATGLPIAVPTAVQPQPQTATVPTAPVNPSTGNPAPVVPR